LQDSSVGGSFITVALHRFSDGFQNAELLGQRGQTGGGDDAPPAAALIREV